MHETSDLPRRQSDRLMPRRPSVTVTNILNARERRGITLKRVGRQHEDPCPSYGGDDRFHVNVERGDNDESVLLCRNGCTFADILRELDITNPLACRPTTSGGSGCREPGGSRTHCRRGPARRKADLVAERCAEAAAPAIYVAGQGENARDQDTTEVRAV